MIVVDDGTVLRLVTQGDHAQLAADILALCRFPELESHPRRKALLEAVREHDNGWRELDAAPQVDSATGMPLTFETLPGGPRRRLWSRGAERLRERDPGVALLICEHALALHRSHAGDPLWDPWLAVMSDLRSELLSITESTGDQLERDYDFLRFADRCSLALCNRSEAPFVGPGVRALPAAESLHLDPLPLAGTTSFNVRCRYIPKRRYESDLDLGGELASARWTTFSIRVTAPPG